MRAAMAYFAGAGTVIAAIGIGLGGGLTIANVMSPHHEKIEQTRLDQRMSAKPVPQTAQADQPKVQAEQPKPLPDVAATNATVSTSTPPASHTQAAAPAPQPSPRPAEAKLAKEQPTKAAEPQTAKSQAAPHEQAAASSDDTKAKSRSAEDAKAKQSPEDANAKADDSDLKRLAAEKRKADRHRKWAERKKAREQRDAELRDGDANSRRDTNRPLIHGNDEPQVVLQQDDSDFAPRRGFDRRSDRRSRGERNSRGDADRPFGFPGFNLFGGDSDD